MYSLKSTMQLFKLLSLHPQTYEKMFIDTIFGIIILLFCLFLLCVKIIFKKGGHFPNTHVGGNPELQKKKIQCVQAQDYEERNRKTLVERIQQEF